jgi:hypothetical protein
VRAVAAAGLLLTGCFYLDPIITRPGVTINRAAPPYDAAYRGNPFILTADFDNPKPRQGRYDWLAFACHVSEVDGSEACDDSDFYSGTDAMAVFDVPVSTMAFPPTLVNRLKVKLQVHDDRGAVATAEENVPVGNGPPTVELGGGKASIAVGVPLDLFIRYGDPDDLLDSLVFLPPEVTPPRPGAPFMLEELAAPADPSDTTHVTVGRRLTPGETGTWSVMFRVRDPSGAVSSAQISPFLVTPDQPPCLEQWQPIAPPPGTALPIFEPTVFQVPLVRDELDAYPRISSARQFGTTRFVWSILRLGATAREVLSDANANRIDVDPAAFILGERVEIRVEIFDRHDTPLPCPDGAATCSITGSPDCLQRQTWRIEAR